jgi:alpha-L-arabinofuranosidase
MNKADLTLRTLSTPLSSALPTSVNVKGSEGRIGLANSGWWGIKVEPKQYTGSFYVRGTYNGNFTASLQSFTSDKVFASAEIVSESVGNLWTQHNFTLNPVSTASDLNNTFSITFNAAVG